MQRTHVRIRVSQVQAMHPSGNAARCAMQRVANGRTLRTCMAAPLMGPTSATAEQTIIQTVKVVLLLNAPLPAPLFLPCRPLSSSLA